jgi:ADP-L-glycero-D-manno-heptose 6-epimerase
VILLTGGAGFIGSNIAADLNALGRTDVVIADVLGTERKWRNIAKRKFADIIAPDKIAAFLKGRDSLTAVIHMGANSSTTASDGDAILESNLHPSMALWEWCTRTRTPLIYASSAATYGDGAEGFGDDDARLDRLRPLNLYGWSKHAFDVWALERAARGECPPQWAGLKFFNVYGPNEYHKGDMQSLVAKTTRPILEGQTIPMFKSHKQGFADGEQLRDFVYVKDCAAVVNWLMSNPGVSGLFNLGTGKARAFRDLILSIGTALDLSVKIEYVDMPENIRNQYQYFTEANMTKLRGAGYAAPFCSIEDGVKDYVRGYLNATDVYC